MELTGNTHTFIREKMDDENHKSAADIVEMMQYARKENANLLLNVGPKGDGSFPEEDIKALSEAVKVLYTRKNAESGAAVKGINTELKLKPLKNFSLISGFTVQSNKYDSEHQFNKKEFFRTPSSQTLTQALTAILLICMARFRQGQYIL